ncbi:MAG TPA: undecaprenyl-phosphate glucose phosphotransferase [Anaerolineae bacterium]|nr:undecaprenyl-phosphate glucose phosphotransferase [Anaerolineae bacterium]
MFERYRRILAIALPVLDAVLINVAFALAYCMRYDLQWFAAVDPAFRVPHRAFVPVSLALTGLLLIIYKIGRVYDQPRGASWFDTFYRILTGTATGIILVVFTFVIFFQPLYSRLIFFYAAILIVILLGASRSVKRIILQQLRKRGLGVDRVLIVGAGEVGRTVMRNIVAQPALGYQIVGFVDDDPEKGATDIGRFKAMGETANLPRLVQELAVDEVILTLPWMYHRKIVSIMAQCERHKVRVRIVPDMFQMSLSRLQTVDLGGVPLIGVQEIEISRGKTLLKRVMDVTIALLGLVFLCPLMLLISLAIRLDSKGPVIFRQIRVGKGERLFSMFKFRSMCENAEEEQEKLMDQNEASGPLFKIRNDPRVTRVGRFLRRTSLDELPQFLNVLLGQMSLVGPRPAPPSEVQRYQPWHKRRLEVSPGLTGLWQVSGRSELTFDEMVLLDLYYIENWSPGLDLQILLRTVPQFFFGNGAY